MHRRRNHPERLDNALAAPALRDGVDHAPATQRSQERQRNSVGNRPSGEHCLFGTVLWNEIDAVLNCFARTAGSKRLSKELHFGVFEWLGAENTRGEFALSGTEEADYAGHFAAAQFQVDG